MKKFMVLFSAIFLFGACSSSNTPSQSDTEIAQKGWDELGQVAQTIACQQYMSLGPDRDERIMVMIRNGDTNGKTKGVAEASLDILKREC